MSFLHERSLYAIFTSRFVSNGCYFGNPGRLYHRPADLRVCKGPAGSGLHYLRPEKRFPDPDRTGRNQNPLFRTARPVVFRANDRRHQNGAVRPHE